MPDASRSLPPLMLILLAGPGAFAQSIDAPAGAGASDAARLPVEISADGRTEGVPGTHAPRARVTLGSTLPFGTTPDWQADLRRQIGGLAIADMDGDGRNDIVAVCYSSNSFPPYDDWREMIFYNSVNGLSSTPGWVSANQTHAGDVQVGDINGDLRPDVVAIRGGGIRADNVEVYFGTMNGGTETAASFRSSFARGAWGTSGDLVDIDNDTDLDLIVTNQGIFPDSFRPMTLYRNDGTGLGAAPDWISADEEIANGVTHADLIGPAGFPELVTAKWVDFNSAVYRNDAGTPGTVPFTQVATDGTDRGAAAGDIDDDGFIEVAFGGSPTTVYRFDGSALVPLFQTNPPFSGPQEVRLHDADGDGDLDLAEIHFSDGRAHIYQNNGGVLDTTPTWTFDAPEVGTAIAFGDLNGDGRDDLAIGYSGNTSVRVFYAEAPECLADYNADGEVNIFDVLGFIDVWGGGTASGDFNDDGSVNVLDVVAFITAWNAGCA